jgi:nucleoside-diphosphate-sugar epimerase
MIELAAFQFILVAPISRYVAVRLSPALMMAVAEMGDFIHRHFLPGQQQLLTPAAVHFLRMGRRVDISKAKRELRYRPTLIAQAVREAYQWFAARGAIDLPRLNSSPGPNAA